MKAKNSLIKPARVPEAAGGIQVNYCKNPACQNFGVPALDRSKNGKNVKDGYTASGGGTSVHSLKCKFCGEIPTIKSNLAISEELTSS